MKSQASEIRGIEHSHGCSVSMKSANLQGSKCKISLQHAFVFGVLVSPWTIFMNEKKKKLGFS